MLCLFSLLSGCSQNESSKQTDTGTPTYFRSLGANTTGLHFRNELTPTADFNMFQYMYFYNGAGIGAADFNNDGLIDLFFASNQGRNRLFLNKGQLRFEDATEAAAIPNDSGWSTGVSVVDINNDGLQDIYVCRVSKFENLKGHNQLLVCKGIENGVPVYKDEAASFGLDFQGFSTQAAFFDYDGDGDLDMYLLNHATDHNGRFAPRDQFVHSYDAFSGDRLYRNDGPRFTDVTNNSGIESSAIGYGLGVVISDINMDGLPDIYVGNDFHENDYLYINLGNGRFSEEITQQTMHTSQFSMGVDAADITNDGFPEIISMDMLPADPYILKRSLGEDTYDVFQMKLRYGYHPYFTRNNLQLNLRNGHFSEAGLYAGIAATDWSWASLWTDFDNDGRKDLFVSNGIPKRLNDIDYVNFISNEEMQNKIVLKQLADSDFAVINRFPEIKLPNCFYRNVGDAKFSEVSNGVEDNAPTFSNGAVYADLDNDGDADIVVNNIADEVIVYENTLDSAGRKAVITLSLKGPPSNVQAVGTRLIAFAGESILTQEYYPVHGFMSSMQGPLTMGIGTNLLDSIFLVWPDGSYQLIANKTRGKLEVQYQTGLPTFNYAAMVQHGSRSTYTSRNVAGETGLKFRHEENSFQEFNREQLIPQMMSTEGPASTIGDLNGDGLDDIFLGNARGGKSTIWLQQANGRFVRSKQPSLDADSAYEDVDACIADFNGDGNPDLVVASGGNEFYGTVPLTSPRLYLNNGQGLLQRHPTAFSNLHLTASTITAADVNSDGAVDLFIGARCEPFAYGVIPTSYLLQNDGKGQFADVTNTSSPGLQQVGLVKHALWNDIDRDGDPDLLVSCQWGGLTAYVNQKGKLTPHTLTDSKGWWNFLLPVDIDGDGDTDFIAGNMGLNNRFNPSPDEPVKLYVSDFDGNGSKEQFLTYYQQGKEIPFANKDELQRQLPTLKKQFLFAEDFAKASLQDIIPATQLKQATLLEANNFSNSVLLNEGNLRFTIKPLPWQAQLTTYRDAVAVYRNGKTLPDILLVGNFYNNNIQMGRNDADYGMLLLNNGNSQFSCEPLHGDVIKGEARQVKAITVKGDTRYLVARNNDSAMLLQLEPTNHNQ